MAARIQPSAVWGHGLLARFPPTATEQRAPAAQGIVSPRASRLVVAAIYALAVFAPLAFGAVETWARALALGLALLAILVWLGRSIAAGRLLVRSTWLYGPLILLAALPASQLLLSRTVDRHATGEQLLWTTGLALVWLVVLNALSPKDARRLVLLMVVLGFAVALFAIFQGLAAPHDTIYFFRDLSQGPTAYGPFVNKNHYAGYMELLAPLPLALVLFGGVRREQRALFLFMSLAMMASVVLSLSRTGAAVVAAQAALLALSLGRRRAWAATIGLLAAVAGGAWWLGGAPLGERLATLLRLNGETSLAVRLQVAADSVQIVRDHPLLGTGLGTFGSVYPRYKTFEDNLAWEHAHNDPVQLAAEGGLAGVLCVLLFLSGLLRLWRGAVAPASCRHPNAAGETPALPDGFRRGALAGIFAGCAGLLAHSLMDFQFQIPANAITFAILYSLGLVLAEA